MFAYVRGKLEEIEDDILVVETAGIGYEIYCANPYQFQESLGQEVKVYTYQYVREDLHMFCLLYTSPSPRDVEESRMPSSA